MRLTENRNDTVVFEDGALFYLKNRPYRVLSVSESEKEAVVCFMELLVEKYRIFMSPLTDLLAAAAAKEIVSCKDEDPDIGKVPELKDGDRAITDHRYAYIRKAVIELYPDYRVLQHRGPGKDVFGDLPAILNLSVKNTRKYFLRFLQSGGAYISVVDQRLLRPMKKDSGLKGGGVRGPKCNGKSNTIENDEILLQFYTETYSLYRKTLNKYGYEEGTRHKPSLRSTWNLMVLQKYGIVGPNGKRILPPESEYPSYSRFYAWVRKQAHGLGVRAMASTMSAFNNQRLLVGTSSHAIGHPGECYEIDASEIKNVLSSANLAAVDQVVGKGVIYIAIDVLTHRITGMHVHIQVNNSYEGLLNLVDSMLMTDEQNAEINCADFTLPVFPGPMLPNEVRVDQGSEYVSHALRDNLTGGSNYRHLEGFPISVNLAPPGTGSLKGIVERFFNELNQRIQDALQSGHGYVNDTHKSGHYKSSCIDILTFRHICYEIVRHVNNAPVVRYPMTPEIAKAVPSRTPVALWNYFTSRGGAGFSVPEGALMKARYGFMKADRKFKLSRKQVSYNDFLYYDIEGCDDLKFEAIGLKDRSRTIEIRYDPRTVEHIFYKDKTGNILVFHLAKKRDNLRAFEHSSWGDFDRFWEMEKKHRYQLRAERNIGQVLLQDSIKGIATENAKPAAIPANRKNIKEAGASERDALTGLDSKKRSGFFHIMEEGAGQIANAELVENAESNAPAALEESVTINPDSQSDAMNIMQMMGVWED